jgi:hypothetical protein
VDLSSFEPFNLIFAESQFFGDDGCNSFGAKYEIKDGVIVPKDFVMTAQICPVQNLPLAHLVESFRIRIRGAELRISALNSDYVYKTEFSNRIDDSPLLAREWKLAASNDPEFADINTPKLRPVLQFDGERTFKIAWNCDQDNVFGCSEIPGLFGVGDAKRIQFYRKGGQVSGTRGLDLVERILGSSSYDFEDNSLTLRKGATFYEFTEQ